MHGVNRMPKLTATLPDGRVVTRTTNHAYTCVIVVQYEDDTYVALSWNKDATTARRDRHWRDSMPGLWNVTKNGIQPVKARHLIPVDNPPNG